MVDRVGAEVLGGDHGLDDFLVEIGADLLDRHFRGVLHRDDHSVHAQRYARATLVAVLDGDLSDTHDTHKHLLSENAPI